MRLIFEVALMGVCAVAVASCGGVDGEPAPATGGAQTATTDATLNPSPTDNATSAADSDTADLERLNARYWDVFIDLQNNPRVEPEVYNGIATREVIEQDLAYIRTELIDNGLHREGAPEFSNLTITIDGDTAQLEVCIDETDWIVIKDGEEVDFDLGVTATGTRADRSSGQWLITEVDLPDDELTVTC